MILELHGGTSTMMDDAKHQCEASDSVHSIAAMIVPLI
jgi:hypothetical protein